MFLVLKYRKQLLVGFLVTVCCFIWYSERYLSRTRSVLYSLYTEHEDQDLLFHLVNDTNCITTLNKLISRSVEGDIEIPSNDTLVSLPGNILECLYRRYITSSQTYCAKRSHHGPLDRSWAVCLDGCYKLNYQSVVVAISLRDDYSNSYSMSKTHNTTIIRFAPRMIMTTETEHTLVFISKTNNEMGDRRKYWTISHISNKMKISKVFKHLLVLDIEQYTVITLSYILDSNLLEYVQQINVRVTFEDTKVLNYIPILDKLKKLYEKGFRIFWFSRDFSCVSVHDKKRISCVFIYLIYKDCRNSWSWFGVDHGHEVLSMSDLQHMRPGEVEDFLATRYLTSIQVHCKQTVRLGNSQDGGWEICHDAVYRPKYPCIVYSFGIDWDFGFDDEIVNDYGCKVYSFDPSMKYNSNRHNVYFKKIGLLDKEKYFDSKRKWNMTTLGDIRKSLKHDKIKIDILKIDIEWDEWRALPNILLTDALSGVVQLLIELHAPVNLERAQILLNLYNQGFRIFWYYRNHFCRRNKAYIEYSICFNVGLVRD